MIKLDKNTPTKYCCFILYILFISLFFSGCINENKICNFENVISDFQIVANNVIDFYNQSDAIRTNETLDLSLCYDYDNQNYYLATEGVAVSNDRTFLKALERVVDTFDNDFPLFYVSVNDNFVYFYNSTGDYAVVYSISGNSPDKFYLDSCELTDKIHKRIKEDDNWYQIFK